MLNDADGQGGGNASDYEARETVADATAPVLDFLRVLQIRMCN
jgi:hypothetical protein